MSIIRKNKFFSLQYKVLIFSIVLTIIPLVSIGSLSYVKIMQVVKEKVSISNMQTVSQTGKDIEYIMRNMVNLSLFLYQSKDVKSFLALNKTSGENQVLVANTNLNNSIMFFVDTDDIVNSTYIKSYQGLTYDSSDSMDELDQATESAALQQKGGYIWVLNKIKSSDNKVTDTFSLVRAINDINDISHVLGILKINVNESTITNLMANKESDLSSGKYYVINQGKILLATDQSQIGRQVPEGYLKSNIKNGQNGYYVATVNRVQYLVTYYNFDKMDLTLINVAPYNRLIFSNNVIWQVMASAVLISFVICVLIAILFSSRILGPIKQLHILMKRVEKEDFDGSIKIAGNDEIAMLGNSFNKMSSRLNALINQVYAVQIKQRESELKALQAQIHPHFLYNTLDTIYWMSKMEKAPETSKLVEALSKLFRLSLNSGNEITTVKAEVDHLKNYIIIQQQRYDSLIEFSVDVEEGTLECPTLKLILQPLVENAIYHGIEKKGIRGYIQVTVRRENDDLVYTVTDDGFGADLDEVNYLLKHQGSNNKGFSIKSVNDRVKLYFGASYGIRFENIRPSGTRVIVNQPFKRREEPTND